MFIEVDGVMAHSDVWINGHHPGRRPNGYVSFRYDISPHLQRDPGGVSIIAVRAGVRVPRADHRVEFAVEGPGVIVAIDNGDNTSHESFQATKRRAYLERCVAWVRATAAAGAIDVAARVDGVEAGSVWIEIGAAASR